MATYLLLSLWLNTRSMASARPPLRPIRVMWPFRPDTEPHPLVANDYLLLPTANSFKSPWQRICVCTGTAMRGPGCCDNTTLANTWVLVSWLQCLLPSPFPGVTTWNFVYNQTGPAPTVVNPTPHHGSVYRKTICQYNTKRPSEISSTATCSLNGPRTVINKWFSLCNYFLLNQEFCFSLFYRSLRCEYVLWHKEFHYLQY